MPETPTFGRYAEISYEQMTTEQQEGYQFVKEVRGQVGGPSKIWIHNPKLAKAAAPLGAHFHPGHYSLSEREREIAVCIINSKWHSAYRADHLRDSDGACQFALGLERTLRPCGKSARACGHHRCDYVDGLLHGCLDDIGVLRRAGRGDRYPALRSSAA